VGTRAATRANDCGAHAAWGPDGRVFPEPDVRAKDNTAAPPKSKKVNLYNRVFGVSVGYMFFLESLSERDRMQIKRRR
jgi:hypothetical protein